MQTYTSKPQTVHRHSHFSRDRKTERKSKTERREFFRFPDYLLTDDKFTELIDRKIKAKVNQSLEPIKLLKTKYNKGKSWRVYNSMLKIEENQLWSI